MATCEHCGDEYSAWDDAEYVFHNDTTGNVPHCVGVKDAELAEAKRENGDLRELLSKMRVEIDGAETKLAEAEKDTERLKQVEEAAKKVRESFGWTVGLDPTKRGYGVGNALADALYPPPQLRAPTEAQKAEIAEAKKDTARLDWSHNNTVKFLDAVYEWDEAGNRDTRTIRAAIDDAREE